MKKLAFVSNFITSHQVPLAREFAKFYGDDYVFILMKKPKYEGSAMKFHDSALKYNDYSSEKFLLKAYESPELMTQAQKIINEAECVILGGIPPAVLHDRLRDNKLTFFYAERFMKGPLWRDLIRFVKYEIFSGARKAARSPDSKFYLLCASAFAPRDYNLCGLFKNKCFKWGYFPETKHYDDINELISRKTPAKILWGGRFINWKHPEFAVKLADNLRNQHINFSLKIAGAGLMYESLASMIESLNLGELVTLTPQPLSTEELRAEMESSQIFIFTSDRGEGWGAVLNESMNSACAVVAGDKIGAAPYLIKDGQNGLLFRNKNIQDLTAKVSDLLASPEKISSLGRAAYETIINEWCAEIAAKNFIALKDSITAGKNLLGPCSVAPVI
ncbi:MAG: glycosyltransferase family 4 protein [Synergistaceae bacterium]|nr:glycosyltransferase family 4 protein [Synergistaceae bacterium]